MSALHGHPAYHPLSLPSACIRRPKKNYVILSRAKDLLFLASIATGIPATQVAVLVSVLGAISLFGVTGLIL